MTTASPAALSEIRSQINAALAAQTAPTLATAASVTPASVGGDFCSLWPNAKPILQAIAGLIAFIPGVGAGAGPVLNALVTVGDQVYKSTCGQP